MVLKCWTGVCSQLQESSLHFADKAQFVSNSTLFAQTCAEATQRYSLYDKEKACASASTAACSHRNLLMCALLDVKVVSCLFLAILKWQISILNPRASVVDKKNKLCAFHL